MSFSSKTLNLGVNGFGRIGRMVTRISASRDDVQVVQINDPFLDYKYMAYLLIHDSTQGRFKGTVTTKEENGKKYLVINNRDVLITDIRDPKDVNWNLSGATFVAECSGVFLEVGPTAPKGREADRHITGGAKKVILSAPSKTCPMYVCKVNTNEYDGSATVISNASCTTNCLAPIVKVLDDNFGIEQGLMTTVHAVTATQATVDGINRKDRRSGRGAAQNIIPASTGAAKAIGGVLKHLKGKLDGMAFRVPVPCGSVVDLTAMVKKDITKEDLNKAMKNAANGELKGILGYTDEDIVSQDVIGEGKSSIYDSKASMVMGKRMVKVISWYDNEYGYSSRLLDLCVLVAKKDGLAKL